MRDRSIPVLLLSILLVGAFIGIQEYWRHKTSQHEMEERRLFDLDLNSLTMIQFVAGESTLDCAKENGIWMVGDQKQGMGRADVAVVYRMIDELYRMGKGTTITAKELNVRGLNASEYGFDSPAVRIEAIDNQGRHSWLIGRSTPLGDEVYVKEAEQDDIYTVSSRLMSLIPSDPDQLRNRILFAGGSGAVKRLEIRGPGGFIRVTKEPSSQWHIQQPIVAQADSQEVDVYIEGLYMLRIDDFIADNVSDLSVYGLQNETRQISVGTSDGTSTTLVVGDEIPGRAGFVYARRADDTSVFAVEDDVLDMLGVSVNRFRNARVLAIAKDDVTGVSVKRGNEQLAAVESENGKWKLTNPVNWEANAGAVGSLVDLWTHAVITEFDVASNNVPSEWILEFSDAGAGITNRIEVLPVGERKDGLFVRLNDQSTVYQINLPFVPDAIIDPLVYKDKRIWKLKRSDINKLSLQKAGEAAQVVELSNDGMFVATQANGNSRVDTPAVDQLINRLCAINTPEYIAYNPRNLDIYGLSEPAIELFVGLVDSNELGRVLLVGRESTDGYYSMVKGRDVVFYLDKATVESISSDLVVRPGVPDSMPE